MFHDPYFAFGILTKEMLSDIMVTGTMGLTHMIGDGNSIVVGVSQYVCSFDPKQVILA